MELAPYKLGLYLARFFRDRDSSFAGLLRAAFSRGSSSSACAAISIGFGSSRGASRLSDPAASASIPAPAQTGRPFSRSAHTTCGASNTSSPHLFSSSASRLPPTSPASKPWDAPAPAANRPLPSSCARRSGSSRRTLCRCAGCFFMSDTTMIADDRAPADAPARAKTSWWRRRSSEYSAEHKSAVPSTRKSSENSAVRSARRFRAATTPPGSIARYSPAARDRDRTPSPSGT